MKIGLVRHFKVMKDYPKGKRYSASDVTQWFQEYDLAEIEEGSTDLCGIEWNQCLVSDMTRARITAEKIFEGTILVKADLREIPAPKFTTKLKLPFLGWLILIRLSVLMNRQTRQDIKIAKERINKVLDEAVASDLENVLIVSHAALMMYMSRELIKRGFHGPKLGYPTNGKLYVFEG
ncbi:histidine phosphatase family protein [Cohnella abietis]|uniref:Phosphoglycerate mutase n=1 Tax=Cohnella abietis TaxID=2507935 RepID=A0A3T1CZY8_9BACL|nr:histidine phosphatase family protein [Cohnella abietis]BBI31329.1 hypothetical protein KCTCHS21_07280 [Cohnella abietis]